MVGREASEASAVTGPTLARVTPRSPRRIVRFALLPAMIVLLFGSAACGGGASTAPTEQLPPAPELLSKSATAMATIKTLAADVQVDLALAALPIRSAKAQLTADGQAVGSAQLTQGGSIAEFKFAVTQGNLYLTGPTGQTQAVPMAMAAAIYDPTALLNPDRGISALLRTATAGQTEASEDVNGVPAYRVRATLDQNLVQSVLPGLKDTSTGLVWIDKATSRLLKAQLDVPVSAGGRTAPVTVTLSDFDAPVTVTPPTPS